ncbi:MAG: NAD(P)-binding domain-containing protein [Saprospiraceae bacterium]|uniref:NAD(P)-binding domain-containing protein n=1 Tax=Candidatus Opimibacter skivensis TaxID=2982028 RepID=A0A9D7XTQ7_9BACT|nr:NAD(P)-binding domain-containing protein [Candidatus Opimibacter skivensis]
MEVLLEKAIIYSVVLGLILLTIYIYVRQLKRNSKRVDEKIKKAKEEGLHEPVSLHPEIDVNTCIQSGACIEACPEKEIIGIRNGKATLINASRCIGHGACFHACPVEAITLVIGTEKRGVDLPHVKRDFETNVPGMYIAGELGGMGLIKNSVEQGKQAVNNIVKAISRAKGSEYDLVIVGAGPAGISATLEAKRLGLNFITLEQDTLGGTVYSFPRAKIVMTSPMDLPLFGKIKLTETTKSDLLELWIKVLNENNITIKQNTKVESITKEGENFKLLINNGETVLTKSVLLAIGRRGTPRKLNVTGEHLEKVAYRLLEPENIQDKSILVVGGGDSAIEAALALADLNKVLLSYRGEAFQRIKVKNGEKINKAIADGTIEVRFNSNVVEINELNIILSLSDKEIKTIDNDLVYIFAGGELPTDFLKKAGIDISTKFGHAVLKHEKKR